MPVVLIVVAAAIVVAVIIVALGRGGELGEFTADFVAFDVDDVTATDVALLRPPPSLCGYHIPATDQALSRIAQTMTERDVEIATLRRQLAELRAMADARAARGPQVPPEWPAADAPAAPGSPTVPGTLAGAMPGPPAAPAVPGPPAAPALGGAAAAGGAIPALPSRPSVRRREMTDPPSAPDPSQARTPWSAWERASGPAASPGATAPDPDPRPAGADDAPAADSELATDTDPWLAQDPAPGTGPGGPGGPGEAW